MVDKPSGMLGFAEDLGLDKYLFSSDGYNYMNNHSNFMISNDYSYTLVNLNGSEGNYLEEGHCETFE
jgi:hypothetical protein